MRRASLVVTLFFGKLILLYALFLIPWPGVRDAYAAGFRAGGNFLFRTFGDSGRVYFEPMAIAGKGFDAYDTNVVIQNLGKGIRGAIPGINSRLMGYLPTAFAASLILATPIPWRRRWIALCLGAALMSGFAAFELWLRLLETFSNPAEFSLYEWPAWGRTLLAAALAIVGKSPVTAYIAPVFVWIVVALRRDDIRRVLGETSDRAARA